MTRILSNSGSSEIAEPDGDRSAAGLTRGTELRSADGGIALGGADGRISLCLSAAQTAALWRPGLAPYSVNRSADLYVAGRWELELTDATGRITRLLQGKLLLSPEVTHA